MTEARNQTAHLLWIRNAAWAIVVILPALAALIVLTSRRQPSMVDLMATVDYETRQLDRLIEAARSSDRLQEQEAVSEFAHKFYGERASLPAENLDGLDQYVKNISGISQEDGAKAKAWIDAKKIELAKSQQDLNTVLKKEIAEQRGRVDRATRALDGARDRQTD